MQQTQSKESNANVLITTGEKQIRRVLVSVFHKEGLEILAEAFRKADTEVVSTGSTAAKLAELGVHVTEVSDITEIGRAHV